METRIQFFFHKPLNTLAMFERQTTQQLRAPVTLHKDHGPLSLPTWQLTTPVLRNPMPSSAVHRHCMNVGHKHAGKVSMHINMHAGKVSMHVKVHVFNTREKQY